MATRRVSTPKDSSRRRPAATTPEGRENQLISLADSLAERQLRDGTASAQVITHYLKLGSSRERLEQQKIQLETQLVEARVADLAAQARIEELYSSALRAMSAYSGREDPPMDEDYDA